MKRVTIKCIVTGREKVFSQLSLKTKVKKYGSIEEYSKNYVCKEAKKLLKTGLSVQDIRDKLKCSKDLPEPDISILIKNKLIKQKKVKNEDREQRVKYLSSDQFKEKTSRNINTWRSFKHFVEWATGGPDGSHVKMGGTCQRPDILLNNGKYCDGCVFYEYCLCEQKRIH